MRRTFTITTATVTTETGEHSKTYVGSMWTTSKIRKDLEKTYGKDITFTLSMTAKTYEMADEEFIKYATEL